MSVQKQKLISILRPASFVLLAVFCSLQWFGCSTDSGGSQMDMQDQLIPAVEAVQTRSGALPLVERLSGVVKAKNQVEIYPEINAVITAVYVQNGDVVKKGDPLVQLRDKEFRERLRQARASYQIATAQVRQAEAQLNEVRGELERVKALSEKGLSSDSELEAIQSQAISAEASLELAKARVDQAQATMDEREETLSQTTIRAPLAGTVGNRNAEVGMLVSSGAQLFTLGQLDSMRIEVVLTDRMLNYIEEGQRSDIQLGDTPTGILSAPLTRISPFLNPVSHSTIAEIDLANSDNSLKPGMFVPVDVYYGESERATLVPLSALYENPMTGGTGIYVCEGTLSAQEASSGTGQEAIALTEPLPFKFVPVEILARGRMEAGVRGVQEGDWVITLGQDLLAGAAGQARVRPVNWNWIQQLQQLQRQDLLKDIMKQQQSFPSDSLN
ncbi:MAG: efflux RND transporter periplasmic adaptor subunit [Deferribacteres bacterium]|nr:efflux RND transporter periplasmic adaptor subunit [candidate division KSB1 bacterium]MCB9510803.1 efflux RND transporter periplasmic adaptor subunit [Deferribacteres bacterium]